MSSTTGELVKLRVSTPSSYIRRPILFNDYNQALTGRINIVGIAPTFKIINNRVIRKMAKMVLLKGRNDTFSRESNPHFSGQIP